MLATLIIFVSLGLDTLAVSLGLGLSGLPRNRWLRVGLTFALFEGLMPVVGLLVGHRLGSALGEIASYAAAGILIAIGLLTIKEARSEDPPAPIGGLPPREEQRPLLLTGLSVGLDELAVGFALGVLRVPLGPSLAYIAVQAFALTFVGLFLGQRLGTRLGERAELMSGVVLTLLGVALLISEATGSHFL